MPAFLRRSRSLSWPDVQESLESPEHDHVGHHSSGGSPFADVGSTGPELELGLIVTDREVIEALDAIEDPQERDEFARAALRVGVMALTQARGQLDAERVRKEGEHLISELSRRLEEHSTKLTAELGVGLREYLDPQSGRFAQRVERMLSDDGELASVLRAHVGNEDSEIAKTLSQHLGEKSPLLKQLDPDQADGLLGRLHEIIDTALGEQRRGVLEQFSLDNPESALTRLVGQITDRQGKLREDLAQDYTKMIAQFSLDDESSALSRLVRQVDAAQRGIVEQFSLDREASALSRLKKELLGSLDDFAAQQRRFQQEVMQNLSAMAARRQAQSEGTAHGLLFEQRLSSVIADECARLGDLFEACGNRTGLIRNCKKGDQVVELGPDSPAPGRRIVFEAKESHSYDDRKALEELQEAKKNRGADVGVFVFSSKVASGPTAFRRVGDDLLVIWDPEEAVSDVYVQAAVSVARALVFRRGPHADAIEVDMEAMTKAVLEIERQAAKLDTIHKSGQTIVGSANKILDEARKMRDGLDRKTRELQAHLDAVHEALGDR